MNRTALMALALAVLSALVLAACGSSSDPNVGSTAIQESPAEAVAGEPEIEVEEATGEEGEESTGEGTEEGAGEGAGTAEEEAEPGSKGSIVPKEGETAGAETEPGQGQGGNTEKIQEGSSATLAAGKTEFEANCGSCHTLAEAGTSGAVGPNLDELMPELALVETQVTNGGGGMPAFQEVLSGEEIAAVAAYVSTVAGTEG